MTRVIQFKTSTLVTGVLAVASLLGFAIGYVSTLQRGVLVAGATALLVVLVVSVGLHKGGTPLQRLVPPSLAIGAVPLASVLWGAGGQWEIAVVVGVVALMAGVAGGALESRARKKPIGPSVEQID